MKNQITFLLLLAMLCYTAVNAKTCRYVTNKKCEKVRRAPYFKKVVTKRKIPVRVKYIKKTRVAYKARVCRTKWKKVAYKKPYNSRKKIKVRTPKRVVTYPKVWVDYWVKVRKTRKVPYQKKYFVNVKKKYTVKTRVKKWKKVTVQVPAICTRPAKKKLKKKVRKPYNAKCPKFVDAVKYVYKYVWITKKFKKKVWSGRYYSSNAENCWKKLYIWKPYVKRVKVKRKVPIKYKKKIMVGCIKFKLVTVTYTVDYIQKYKCKKKKEKSVPYFVIVTRVLYKTIKVPKVKTLYKYVPYFIRVKRRKQVKKKKVTITYYMKTIYVKVIKTKTVYRKESSVYYVYVTRYKFTYKVAYKTVYKTKLETKKVPVKYYINKCTLNRRKVCS